MQIIWSERAFERRMAIEDYIFCSFGYEAYQTYQEQIEDWKRIVVANPRAGAIEPILEGARKEYRSFSIGDLTKCIYYIENDFIVFVDWWDTRRCPASLTKGLK